MSKDKKEKKEKKPFKKRVKLWWDNSLINLGLKAINEILKI